MASTTASTTASPPTSQGAHDAGGGERLFMTYDEYWAWYDKEAGRRGEWVDGEVIRFVSTTFTHENLLAFLTVILRIVVSHRRLGVVVGSGYELRTREGSAREPDLMVILNQHRDRITERRLVGAADIVVEVISPDSVTRDRRDKFAEYAAAGIPEYWVADPREGRETFDIFVLDAEGYYVPTAEDANGRLNSKVIPGVWVERRWLTDPQLPDESQLAMRMAGIRVDP